MTSQTKVFVPIEPSRSLAGKSGERGGKGIFHRLGLAEDRTEMVKRIHRGFPVNVI